MDVVLNSLYNISTNNSVKPSVKEVPVSQDDSLKTAEAEEQKKLEEEKRVDKSNSAEKLSQDEKRLVTDLQSRDAEVRTHEAAHQSGGASTGGASYTYQKGPDGRMYAIGGEVSISFQTGSTPQETIVNAQAVIASALAPADPSAQDIAVASSAMIMMMKAQQQVTQEAQEKLLGKETYKNAASTSDESKDIKT
ncbi:MAG: putative metalloprotease CJM1_0395 family protein [Sulfurimonas denitrificans]|nr:putative metalloprotease CJM1_0395 family protein [Sulfurimonas denitrificans]